jgi:hypothetical protein
LIRRGWRNESVRHSLAAKGIKTNYLKRKKKIVLSTAQGIAPENIVAKKKFLTLQLQAFNEDRKFAQQAKGASGVTKQQRADLEKIRKYYAETAIGVNKELKEVSKAVDELRAGGKATPLRKGQEFQEVPLASRLTEKEDLELREFERSQREKQQVKAKEIQKNVQENLTQDQVEDLGDEAGFPTRAKINTVPGSNKTRGGASQVGARKRNVVVSGRQGTTADETGVSKADLDNAEFIERSAKKKITRVKTETDLPDPQVDSDGNKTELLVDSPAGEVKMKGLPTKITEKVQPAKQVQIVEDN